MEIVRERCVLCGAEYPARFVANVCPDHDGLAGILDVVPSEPITGWRAQPTEATLHRYAELLPVRSGALPDGYLQRTPLVAAPRLARDVGVAQLLIKDEGRNPSGSLKDRSSALAVELAVAHGAEHLACASTGNAASSLAAACAAAGLPAHVFVPDNVPAGKLAQTIAYGAQVFLVAGTYDDAYYLCEDVCRELGWYDRNCAVNPYLVEGKKTCAYEIAEQLGPDGADWVSVSVGDGCTVAALARGFERMREAGVIARVPRMLAVQPRGASAIAHAWERNQETADPMPTDTIADSVAVAAPRNAVKAIRAVRAGKGTFWTVSDAEILDAQRDLATLAGVFAEPGAAAGIAAVRVARRAGVINGTDRVVHVVTGTGLKTVGSVQLDGAQHIECSVAAVRRFL